MSSNTLVFPYMASSASTSILPYMAAWFAPVGIAYMLRQQVLRGVVGKPVITDPTPLHDEICAIARHFGLGEVEVRTTPVRLKNENEPMEKLDALVNWQTWYRRFNVVRPHIPMDLLQSADSNWITAAIAVSYAQRAHLPKSMHWLHRLVRRGGIVGMAVVALLLFFVTIVLPIISPFGGIWLASITGIACLTLLVLALVYVILPALTRRNSLQHAYIAWRAADPAADRQPLDFLECMFQFDLLIMGLDKMEPLIDAYKVIAPVRRFTESQLHRPASEVVDEIIARVRGAAGAS